MEKKIRYSKIEVTILLRKDTYRLLVENNVRNGMTFSVTIDNALIEYFKMQRNPEVLDDPR